MIDLHKLRIFCAIVDSQSFSVAASELRLSQPVISNHMRHLESATGMALIDRSKRPVGPTEAGKLLYDSAKRLLSDMNEVEMLVAELKSNSGGRGEVVISAMGMLGSAVVPPLVARFRELHPRTEFHVIVGSSRDVTSQTLSGLCHFGLLISEKPPPLLASRSAGPIELVIVAASDGQGAVKPRSAVELIKQKGLAVPSKKMQFLAVLEKMLKRRGVSNPPVRYDVGSWEAAKVTVLRGSGVTILPRQWVAEEIARGQLQEIKLEGERLCAPVFIIQKPRKPFPPAVRRFRDFLIDELSAASRETNQPAGSHVANS